MNTKSIKIFHLLAFSSMIFLPAGYAAASVSDAETPALQISNERWAPPSPPSESFAADAPQTPALQISSAVWQTPPAVTKQPRAAARRAAQPVPVPAVVSTPLVASAPEAALPVRDENQRALEELHRHAVFVPVRMRTEQNEADAVAVRELQAQIDSLARQNGDLQTKLKTASETPVQSAENKAAVETLQSQIDSLAKQNTELEARLRAGAQAAPSLTADQNAQVLKSMQDQIDTLARGNLELQAKLRGASAAPGEGVVSSISGAPVRKMENGHPVVVQKNYMSADFRSNNDEARRAAALAPASGAPEEYVTPLPENRISARVVKPAIAEKPTFAEEDSEPSGLTGEIEKLKNRYKQSEAENAKLGDLVKVVKDQCEQEKTQMQSMLFDPQIADEQQRAYIGDLEQQLGEAQAALAEQKRSYEMKIRLLKNSKGVKQRSSES